jgi:uncharacterized protein YllA (UPF0747 family)
MFMLLELEKLRHHLVVTVVDGVQLGLLSGSAYMQLDIDDSNNRLQAHWQR